MEQHHLKHQGCETQSFSPGARKRKAKSPAGFPRGRRAISPEISVQTTWICNFFAINYPTGKCCWAAPVSQHTPCPQPQPDRGQETHLVPARSNPGADDEDAGTLKLGKGDIHADRESQQNKPDVGDRPGGKHVVSYLVKPGFVLAVLKHSGVEGETWRGERRNRLVGVRGSWGGGHRGAAQPRWL